MTINEFIDYIEQQLTSKESFYGKAMDDQLARNSRRAPAKRWNEVKMTRVIDKQWKELLTNIYNQIRPNVKKTTEPEDGWIEYIAQDDFVDSINESIYEIEFE
ncbi:hypothetical protein I6N95_22730 [Vagococcus sp. BWB3-3]|uniref:Uncharacterized protein n=1 Tax=Vagococcus allomyrinae TaxID=2794353 RepID=A0A940P8U4_9ENTE|nr:hypothetical protein [Vagococcus allomyrinae]MBP1043849.1 hypothetical protein [Vagococcus allomyrinae]